MKNVFYFATLLLSLMSFAVPLGKIEVKGLSTYQGKYISAYLVSAQKLLGNEPTINHVYNRLGTLKITNAELTFEANDVEESWDAFSKPNFIVVVIHKEAAHALNRYPISNGKFELVEYEFDNDIVTPTEENKIEIIRKSYGVKSLDDLGKDISVDFAK